MRIKIAALLFCLFTCNNKGMSQGTWSSLSNGPCKYAVIYVICADTINNLLYVGGEFDSAGLFSQYALAKWDGTKWDTTTSFFDSTYHITALIMYQGNLMVGLEDGKFGSYDGKNWKLLPGVNNSISCFSIYNDTLYAGGAFTQGQNGKLDNIAKWDGNNWLPVVSGFGQCCTGINAMINYKGDLIVGGLFDSVANLEASGIAAYDGNNWMPLKHGVSTSGQPGIVSSLATFNGKLDVGGGVGFDMIDTLSCYSCQGVWDGSNWDTLPYNTYSEGWAMQAFDGFLFMGGFAGYYSQYIIKYNGDSVSSVDSGVLSDVYAMYSWKNSLFVGGILGLAGNVPVYGIARWTPDSTTTDIHGTGYSNGVISVYPNPVSNQLTFSSSSSIEQIQIENVLGQTLIEKTFGKGLQRQTIDLGIIPQGIYFYRVTGSNSQLVTGKFIKE